MSQLWKSSLNQGLHPKADRLNRSIGLDYRLWKQDIEGSKGHTKMLIQSHLISTQEGEAILSALDGLYQQISEGKKQPDPSPNLGDEDVHSWIERELVSQLGPLGS